MAVRRLTPRLRECCRLQGVPDDFFLDVIHRGKPLADGAKYKMLGNGFAVPVIRYIGQRIEAAVGAKKSPAAETCEERGDTAEYG